jgi:RHS repeat-associated protein
MVAPHSNRPGSKLNVIRPGYNEANLLERVDLWGGQANEPTTLLNPNTASDRIVKTIDYDAKGQRIRIDYGNNSSTAYTYDRRTFRLMRLHTTRTGAFAASPLLLVNSGTLQDLNYVYDPVGNITEIRDAALPVISYAGEQVEPVSRYTYDALYRLIEARGREHAGQTNYQPIAPRDNDRDYPFQNLPNANDMQALRNYTERYDYDAVGNILAMIHSVQNGGWNRAYDYESSNNRLRATSLPGDAAGTYSAKYGYDKHGNMTRMPHLPLMQWDFKDQLRAASQQVRNGGTPETTYFVYDASGERVRKVTERQNGTLKNERIYLGGFEIYREYNGDGTAVTLERETLHVMDDQRRVALVETKTLEIKDGLGGRVENLVAMVRYQLNNHLGSASLELDKAGNVLSYEEYHPYGTTSYQAKSSVAEVSLKRYRYTGKERDEETGLYYHGARYYAAWLGRWASCDPIGIAGGINVFVYTSNSPINRIDPNGMEDCTFSPFVCDPAKYKPSSNTPEAAASSSSTPKVAAFGSKEWEAKERLKMETELSRYGQRSINNESLFDLQSRLFQARAEYAGQNPDRQPAFDESKESLDTSRERSRARDKAEYRERHPNSYDLMVADMQQVSKATDPSGVGLIKAPVALVYMAAGQSPEEAQKNAGLVDAVAGIGGMLMRPKLPEVVIDNPGGIVGTTGLDSMAPAVTEVMPTLIHLDTSVLSALQRNDTAVTTELKMLQASGADIKVSRAAFTEASQGSKNGAARAQIAQAIGIDEGLGLESRIDFYTEAAEKGIKFEGLNMGKKMPGDLVIGASAKARGATLWTLEKDARLAPLLLLKVPLMTTGRKVN